MPAKRIATAALVCCAIAGGASADKAVRPATLAELATVWVGCEAQGRLEYLRLELDREGHGLVTMQWLPGEPADAYRIVSTRLDRYDVEFTLQPVDRDAEPMSLSGRAIGVRLDLEAVGSQSDWKRKFVLDRYDDLWPG